MADTKTGVDQFVEVYSTIVRRRGDVQRIEVDVEYFDEDDNATRNKVTFEVSGGVGYLESFETPIGTVQDLAVVPAAETVARTVPGIESVVPSFSVLEEVLNDGHWGVENRMELNNVPDELREGFEMEDR